MRTLRLTVAAGLAIVLAPLYGVSPAQAADDGTLGIRLLEAPIDRKADPRARSYIIDYLPPGITIKRKFEVENNTDTPRLVDLYPAAGSISKGSFQFAPGRTPNELSKWITLSTPRLLLPAQSRREVQATIAVPKDASEDERYAVIWAQMATPPDGKANVGIVNRVGIRVYLGVGPGGEPPTDFKVASVVPERLPDGRPQLRAKVTNTGGRAVDLSASVQLTDGPGGINAGPFKSGQPVTLLPQSDGEIVVPLDSQLPAGPWTARVTLTSGETERSASAKVTFPPAGQAAAVQVSKTSRAQPLMLLVGSLLIFCLALWAALTFARRRARS